MHEHPYFPQRIVLLNYIANTQSVTSLLVTFACSTICFMSSILLLLRIIKSRLTSKDTACVLWFVFTGSLHVLFEGYYIVHNVRIVSRNDLFASLWKEYAKSDSRYLTGDTIVLCLETITVFLWGPLSCLTALLIIRESPLRHSLQALVSVGHLYSDTLYYLTSLFDHYGRDITYYRPEPYYFWVYYFAMNFVWIIVPAYWLHDSIKATSQAFSAMASKQSKSKVI